MTSMRSGSRILVRPAFATDWVNQLWMICACTIASKNGARLACYPMFPNLSRSNPLLVMHDLVRTRHNIRSQRVIPASLRFDHRIITSGNSDERLCIALPRCKKRSGTSGALQGNHVWSRQKVYRHTNWKFKVKAHPRTKLEECLMNLRVCARTPNSQASATLLF